MTCLVRNATPADAAPIAKVHVGAWRETYPGLVPDDMLARLDIDRSTAFWCELLQSAPASADVFVAQDGASIVGFGSCAAQRSPDLAGNGFDGEITALYVLRSHQKRGLGRRLVHALAARLHAAGRRGASLWVLRGNALASAFYEAMGGVVIGAREEARDDWTLDEVAYGWRDLPALMRVAGQ